MFNSVFNSINVTPSYLTTASCANCGKGEDSSGDLKVCSGCKILKYCNRDCQIAHRPQHKKACKKRAAELQQHICSVGVRDEGIDSDVSDDEVDAESTSSDEIFGTPDKSYRCADYSRLNADTFEKLKKNDPSITKLLLHFDDDDPEDFAGRVNWIYDGYCIGNNTHLKELEISVFCYSESSIGRYDLSNFEALYEAVSWNRSLEHLSLSGSLLKQNVYSSTCVGEGRMLHILLPFFERNHSLHSICIEEIMANLKGEPLVTVSRVLTEVLSRCNKKFIRAINLHSRGIHRETISNEGWLTCHCNLKKLALQFEVEGSTTNYGLKYCASLGNVLTNPHSRLEELNLLSCSITDEGLELLGTSIGRNTTLKKLGLRGGKISAKGLAGLSRELLNSSSALEVISLTDILSCYKGRYGIDTEEMETQWTEAMESLGSALSSIKTLRCLDLSNNYFAGGAPEWEALLRGLSTSNFSLEKLILGGKSNDIGNVLGDILLHNSTLKELSLQDIETASWATLFRGVAYPQSTLEVLNLRNTTMDNEGLVALGHGLPPYNEAIGP